MKLGVRCACTSHHCVCTLWSCSKEFNDVHALQVRDIVGQGGRCLIPVVALGRAQELLLILEDCWNRHPELRSIPIHQTSGIATQSLGVYQSYIEMMNDDIRATFKQRNPFDFRHVRHTRGFRGDSELGPCVVLATPSMLQTGLSRELFEAWCEDARNGVIIADFAVQVRRRRCTRCKHAHRHQLRRLVNAQCPEC